MRGLAFQSAAQRLGLRPSIVAQEHEPSAVQTLTANGVRVEATVQPDRECGVDVVCSGTAQNGMEGSLAAVLAIPYLMPSAVFVDLPRQGCDVHGFVRFLTQRGYSASALRVDGPSMGLAQRRLRTFVVAFAGLDTSERFREAMPVPVQRPVTARTVLRDMRAPDAVVSSVTPTEGRATAATGAARTRARQDVGLWSGVGEMAALQQVPAAWRLCGALGAQYRMIGHATPRDVCELFAGRVLRALTGV